MARAQATVEDAARELCLALPETEEFLSHGAPNFRVRKRTFAIWTANHHGDGRLALWLNVPPGSQLAHVDAQPKHFFVPPYLGPRGWLGVCVDRGLAWRRIAALVLEAWRHTAPPALAASVTRAPVLSRQPRAPSASERDPLQAPAALRVLAAMRGACLSLPETSEVTRYGAPAWAAGSKVYASVQHDRGVLCVLFKVGVEQQALLTADARFRIPAYLGNAGWIALAVPRRVARAELDALALQAWRRCATRRMLRTYGV